MMERADYSGHKGWRGPRRPVSAEDRAAFLDARIAAVKAGLKLTAEQEKFWGPVETTVRELGKKWGDRMAARRDEWQKRREELKDGKEPPAVDHVDRLRKRADSLAERAADMKRFADAAEPLYAKLDEGQKRRLQSLIGHRYAGRMHHWNNDRDYGPRRG
ncbi:MAG: Spy/CpxP family protein refolding chaperone [Rhizobiales bacterium]|nr:Spy/CpxP family protein refolding chaperone [Hyphomicrobiales bacterium]